MSGYYFFTNWSFSPTIPGPPYRWEILIEIPIKIASSPTAFNPEQILASLHRSSNHSIKAPSYNRFFLTSSYWESQWFSHGVCSPLVQGIINSTCLTTCILSVVFGWRTLAMFRFFSPGTLAWGWLTSCHISSLITPKSSGWKEVQISPQQETPWSKWRKREVGQSLTAPAYLTPNHPPTPPPFSFNYLLTANAWKTLMVWPKPS